MSTDPRTQWRETVPDDEAARFTRYADDLRALQKGYAKGDALGRALHLKGHVGCEAVLTVRPDLPEELKVSLFATQGPQRAMVRFSNAMGRRQKDGAPDVRGFALKVYDVPGRKLIEGLEHCTTQDFLFITTPTFSIGSPDDFVTFLKAEAKGQALLLPRLFMAFGVGRTLGLLKRLLGTPQPRSLATVPYYTAAPVRFGPFAAKLQLVPVRPVEPAEKPIGVDGYRDELIARLQQGDVVFSLRAQLYVDDTRTPIEDASVLWTDEASPPIELATLTLPRVDLATPEGRDLCARVEAMSFDPWHAVEEFRPLGAVMRARKYAYGASVIARGASPEP